MTLYIYTLPCGALTSDHMHMHHATAGARGSRRDWADPAAVASLGTFTRLRRGLAEVQRQHAAARTAADAALARVDRESIAEDRAARAKLKEEAAATKALQADMDEQTRQRCVGHLWCVCDRCLM